METLQALISRQINKSFGVGAVICALLLAGYSIFSVRQAKQQAELLIMSQVSSLAQSASMSQDLYSVQKEMSRFVESLNQTQPYTTRIEVWLDGRLIGSAGENPSLAFFSSRISKSLPNGTSRSFKIIGLVDHTRSLFKAFFALVTIILVVGFSVSMMRWLIHRALFRLTDPLTALIAEIERISHSLPGALTGAFNYPQATTREISALSSAVNTFISEISGLQATLLRAQADKARFEIASQVAHDIRSPLAALAAAERDLAILPEDTRIMIRGAVARIRDIANELLAKNKPSPLSQASTDSRHEDTSPQLLSSLIEGIITEKRMQYRSRLGVEIEFSLEPGCYGIFGSLQSKEFKRVLSNLINNAVEAMPETGTGKVEVRLASVPTGTRLQVRDNGQGIPPEILGKLTERGETHGKAGGSGLGLYHARKSCEAWGGTLAIESAVGQGTVLTLTLPQCPSPAWFTERLTLKPGMTVVVLDDDPSIHRIWQGRWEPFRAQAQGIQLEHFSTPDQLRDWHRQRRGGGGGPLLCLVDYELLGFKESGLDMIQELGLGKQSVLVTSRFEENLIRERCLRLEVTLLPKGMAGFVPIELAQPKDRPDYVLVDDDPLVHLMWKMAARKSGHHLRAFTNAADFLAVVDQIDECTPMYIDESLGAGQSGLTIARNLHLRGFKRLFLATGYSPEHFGEQPWLEGVVGKDPPAMGN